MVENEITAENKARAKMINEVLGQLHDAVKNAYENEPATDPLLDVVTESTSFVNNAVAGSEARHCLNLQASLYDYMKKDSQGFFAPTDKREQLLHIMSESVQLYISYARNNPK